jgi:superfamily I DNA/RNA helicase
LQAIVDSGNFNIPTAKVRTAIKKQKREEILKDISQCWDKVINKRVSYFDSLRERSGNNPIIKQIVDALDSIRQLVEDDTNKFIEKVTQLLKPWINPKGLLFEISRFLDELRGLEIGGTEAVRILTIQQAKGLEAEVVIIVGLDKDVFPRENIDASGIEEVSRLFYVSMTRAKIGLHLFHARTREAAITFLTPPKGQKYNILDTSPFIKAIPDDHMEKKYIGGGSSKKSEK